mmetsp:Transcript_35459/g.93917  ORF Transcript_35459/g.93917 Transcript_35459/m.93917 type:complete len:285 (-) Transcript_35459:32-886(-)
MLPLPGSLAQDGLDAQAAAQATRPRGVSRRLARARGVRLRHRLGPAVDALGLAHALLDQPGARLGGELEVVVVVLRRGDREVQVVRHPEGVGLAGVRRAPQGVVLVGRTDVRHHNFVLLAEDLGALGRPDLEAPGQLADEPALPAAAAAHGRGGAPAPRLVAGAAAVVHGLGRGHGQVLRARHERRGVHAARSRRVRAVPRGGGDVPVMVGPGGRLPSRGRLREARDGGDGGDRRRPARVRLRELGRRGRGLSANQQRQGQKGAKQQRHDAGRCSRAEEEQIIY